MFEHKVQRRVLYKKDEGDYAAAEKDYMEEEIACVRSDILKYITKNVGEKLSAEHSDDLLGELDPDQCGFVSLDRLCEVLLGSESTLDVDV